MSIVIISAGDLKVASRLHQFLLSKYSPNVMRLEIDEITITDATIESSRLNRLLETFLSSNSDLSDYSITQNGEIFTIGLIKNIHDLLNKCELCAFIAHDQDEMMIHRRLHAIL